jgi:hypothetical protein
MTASSRCLLTPTMGASPIPLRSVAPLRRCQAQHVTESSAHARCTLDPMAKIETRADHGSDASEPDTTPATGDRPSRSRDGAGWTAA